MKKITSVSLILFSALFLSACGVKENGSSTTTPSLQQEETGSSSFSLRDLIAKNIPQKCTWTSTQEDTKSTGTMVISGNKFKQEVSINEKESTLTMHIISDGTWIYSWQENPTAENPVPAMKMKFEETQEEATDLKDSLEDAKNSQSSFGSVVDYDDKIEYNCSPTAVTGDEFTPPKNIEFTDYSQFMQDIQSQMPSINPADFE